MDQPTRAATLNDLRNRAAAAHRAGKPADARALYSAFVSLQPGDSGIWTNLGALLRSEKRHDLALRAQERAFALDPKSPIVRGNLANILTDIGQAERALELRRGLVAEGVDLPNQKAMLGKALRALGRHDEGIAHLQAACAAHPDHAEMRIQLALTQLASGRYPDGFRNYEIRWETGEMTPRKIARPKWDGGALDGKTILVMPEQGFGDAVAFARFLPVLRRYNPARVMLYCEKPLMRLFADVEGVDWAGDVVTPQTPFDVWTNMMDLPPLHFDASDTIPAPTRLSVPEDARARAATITAPFRDRFRVGVVWCGSVTYRGNAFRSFSHTEFHRLLGMPDLQLFSLYKGPELEAFKADGSAAFIVDTASTDRDFADCAATMQAMDLIVTSDTATAHIAGTLGVPVWTLLHWDSFWLWRREVATTPWYPSMRLIRQSVPRDWNGVFAKVERKLAAQIDAWRKARADG